MSTMYVLFESASGFALLEQTESDEIGQYLEEMQSAMCDLSRLSKVLKLKAFVPFKSAEEALAAANDASEGMLNETLKSFLEMNLPSGKKAEKKGKVVLGVLDSKLGSAIGEELGIKCTTADPVPELLRAVRLHLSRYIKGLEEADQSKASLGLAHSYSRSKVKFNVNRQDNMIIQSISLLDTLDKDINTFAMRIKEWYGWHFPELVKIVGDNYKYARCVRKILAKSSLSDESVDMLQEILDDDEGLAKQVCCKSSPPRPSPLSLCLAVSLSGSRSLFPCLSLHLSRSICLTYSHTLTHSQVVEAAKTSMGYDISEVDMLNVQTFADRVINLEEYRQRLREYLNSRMHSVRCLVSNAVCFRGLLHGVLNSPARECPVCVCVCACVCVNQKMVLGTLLYACVHKKTHVCCIYTQMFVYTCVWCVSWCVRV